MRLPKVLPLKVTNHRSKILFAVLGIGLLTISILGQSGNRPHANASGGVMVGVVARREDNRTTPITSKEVSVYDNGIEQSIRNSLADFNWITSQRSTFIMRPNSETMTVRKRSRLMA